MCVIINNLKSNIIFNLLNGGGGLLRNLFTLTAVVLLQLIPVMAQDPTVSVSNGDGPNTIDLNGEWDFTYTPYRQSKPPANTLFNATIVVPGYWDDSPNVEKRYDGEV